MFTFLKGILIGIGKVIPGVSGSLIAISLGVYEKCIDIISNFFTEIKYNFRFLFLLGLGILTSIILGSNIIYLLINNCYFITMFLFLGLIIGTLPNILKKNKLTNKNDFFYLIIPFILIFIISILNKGTIIIENNLLGYIITIILGFIDAVTMIVPGISGTAIFIILGTYEFVLLIFSKLLFPFVIFFMIGVFIGIIITSKLINYCFKNYNKETYLVIIGFILSSVLLVFIDIFTKDFSLINLLIGSLLFIIGYLITHFFDKQ